MGTRLRRATVAASLVLAAVAASCATPSGDGATTGSVGEGDTLLGDPPAVTSCRTISQPWPVGDRSCEIRTPAGTTNADRLPAVVLLHSLGDSAAGTAAYGHWYLTAAERRFVLVLPDGFANSWNAGGCCPMANSSGVDDLGYLRAVTDQVRGLAHVDPDRVFVVGSSNGGMMAYTFGCRNADRIAGIASGAGTPVASCPAARPLPVLHVHGTDDEHVPYGGGASAGSGLLGATFQSVPTALASVAGAMGCGDPPTESTLGTVAHRIWPGCDVWLVTVEGMTHSWPTGAPFDATEAIVDHFGL